MYILTFISNTAQQIFSINSFINSLLVSVNSSFYSISHFYGLSFFVILVNSSIFSNYFIINLLQQLQNPKNNFRLITLSRSCQSIITQTFFRFMLIYLNLIINPIKSIFFIQNLYFLIATGISSLYNLFKTHLIYSLYFSLLLE